jgi:hypothetical protein
MDGAVVAEARELLLRVIAGCEAGELVASQIEAASLRGAVAALDSLDVVRDTTV